VLLVGPRQVGKTALLHEFVYRRVAARGSAFRDRDNVWLLAPARLISGMSYVGQWENRLLAILKEARRRRHVLYFDDLLGLFLAGHSSGSTLSVADVLQAVLERRDVQVVGEITPEALRVLREARPRLCGPLPLAAAARAGERARLVICSAVQRQPLEGRHLLPPGSRSGSKWKRSAKPRSALAQHRSASGVISPTTCTSRRSRYGLSTSATLSVRSGAVAGQEQAEQVVEVEDMTAATRFLEDGQQAVLHCPT